MGLFEKLFGNQKPGFCPDLSAPEYDNWLNFIAAGGTSAQWKQLKSLNNWIFPESKEEKFEKYQKEVKPISHKYFKRMEQIQKNWSVLSKSKDYCSPLAEKIEQDCLLNIDEFLQMTQIDAKHGHKAPERIRIPAFTRLAMLYQHQGRYEKSLAVCVVACAFGADETPRIKALLKKIGREPNPDESAFMNKFAAEK